MEFLSEIGSFLLHETISHIVFGFIIGAYIKKILKVVKKNLYILGDTISSKNNLSDTWKATFLYQNEQNTETIRLYIAFDKYVLGVIDDTQSKHNNSVRLYGLLENKTNIKGTWYHPDEEDSHNGVFDLTLNQNGKSITGIWTGKNVKSSPQTGSWNWLKP